MTPLMGPKAPDPPIVYRVEHHAAGEIRVLGGLMNVPANFWSLDLFVGPLLREGAGGELRLVDEASGAVAARRMVRPFVGLGRSRPGRG
jgi:hypothetical protein